MTSADQSATSIQSLLNTNGATFLMTSHVRSALWTLLLNIYNFVHYIHRTEGHCNTLLLHNGRNLLWKQACCVKSNTVFPRIVSTDSFFFEVEICRYIRIVSAITLLLCSKCCGNYLRVETIQGRKLFAEIR